MSDENGDELSVSQIGRPLVRVRGGTIRRLKDCHWHAQAPKTRSDASVCTGQYPRTLSSIALLHCVANHHVADNEGYAVTRSSAHGN